MQKDTIIYVTDQRQKYLADMLGGEQTDCRNSGGIDYERVGNIVFPTPFSKLKLINRRQARLMKRLAPATASGSQSKSFSGGATKRMARRMVSAP